VFSETPELYDLIYGSFKDYGAEAGQVAALLANRVPQARTVLDVACGTGEHARILGRDHGYQVDGLDMEPGFLELARRKVPEARFWQADMADFDLGVEFDAVICLFSSIGYLESLARVESAFGCFRRHLAPGGVVLVEPWLTPDVFHPGRVYMHTSNADDTQVVRMSHSTVEGRVSRLEFHYLVGTSAGIEHRIEEHVLLMSTPAEIEGALRRAGFGSVEYDPEGLTGRGLFCAMS
jgi:ubiquinone/menaquinone biosynthesis C-methylase UbiE